MNAAQLFADINTECLVEVESAKCHYFDSVRGLTVRQQFFIYPDETTVCLNSVDGGYSVVVLGEDDAATLRNRNPFFFQ